MTSVEQPSATFRPSALLGGTFSPSAGHLPFASDLIAALKPSLIVKLGVSFGDTYFGFCQLVSEFGLACSIYGIDTWGSDGEARSHGNGNPANGSKAKTRARESSSSHGSIFDAVSRHNNAHYESYSHLLRKRWEEALPQFADESIGLLSIDEVQSFDTLRGNFDSWLVKVQPGGVILIHNIGSRTGEAAAPRLWNEIKSKFPHFAFRNNNGLGVMAKPSRDGPPIAFLAGIFDASQEEQERTRRYYSLCAERLELAARLGTSTLSDTGYSQFQVFCSHDYTYETTSELSPMITPGIWINLHLDLPNGLGDRPLRLDIANRPAVVDIAALSLRKEDGNAAWTWNPKDVTDQLRVEGTATRMPEPEFFRVLALGASPHVFLPEFVGAAFQHPLELEIRLRVDLELFAVKEMTQKWARFQKDNLESNGGRAVEVHSTGNSTLPATADGALARAKADSAKYLAQSRIDYDAKIRQLSSEADARVEISRAEVEALRLELESAQAEHRQVLETQLAQLAEERRNHHAAAVEKEHLLAQQPGLLQEISIAKGNVEELKAEVERMGGEMANMEFDLAEVRKLNARLAATLEEERATRADMQESGSWQLTKPLRVVGDLFGPRKKY